MRINNAISVRRLDDGNVELHVNPHAGGPTTLESREATKLAGALINHISDITGVWFDDGGQPIRNVHNSWDCRGEHCCIHNPSDHSMAHLPRRYRFDRRIMERICQHGVGHPDPDDLRVRTIEGESIHGCCAEGCCSP